MYLGLISIPLFVFNLTSRVSTLPPVIVDELSYQDSMDLQVFIFIIELLLTNSDLHDLNNSQGFFIFTYNVCLCWQGLQWLQLTRRPCGRMADISYRRKNSWMRTGSLWKMVSWKKSYTCLSLSSIQAITQKINLWIYL